MKIFYFTSTGNSLFVSKSIGGELYSIPQLMQENKFEFKDDVIGLVFPIYLWGLPKIVKAFLEQSKWDADYIFAIATYGEMPGATMKNLVKKAENHGIHIDYTNTLKMVDNYLPGFDIEKQLSTLPAKNVDKNLEVMINDISNRTKNKPTASVPIRIMTSTIQAANGIVLNPNKAQKFIVDEHCTKCGICAKVCPVANIDVGETVSFEDKCEVCLGCAHVCPENAIHSKSEKSNARYRNEDVTVKEIIDSNCRI